MLNSGCWQWEVTTHLHCSHPYNKAYMLVDFCTLPKLMDTETFLPNHCTFWPQRSSPKEKYFQKGRGCARQLGSSQTSISECSHSAGFANEVFQEIMVHVCKALSLCDNSQMVYAKSEAKFFQVLGINLSNLYYEWLIKVLTLLLCFKYVI